MGTDIWLAAVIENFHWRNPTSKSGARFFVDTSLEG